MTLSYALPKYAALKTLASFYHICTKMCNQENYITFPYYSNYNWGFLNTDGIAIASDVKPEDARFKCSLVMVGLYEKQKCG